MKQKKCRFSGWFSAKPQICDDTIGHTALTHVMHDGSRAVRHPHNHAVEHGSCCKSITAAVEAGIEDGRKVTPTNGRPTRELLSGNLVGFVMS